MGPFPLVSAPMSLVSALLLTVALAACAVEETADAGEAMQQGSAAAAERPSVAADDAAMATASPLAGLDLRGLARQVVENSARIGEGDKVAISGSVRDRALMEELAVTVRRLGAFPHVSLASEELDYRLVAEVPETWDTQDPELSMALAEVFDVVLTVDYLDTPDLFADIPPERLARMAGEENHVAAIAERRGTRVVNLGNEVYPTAATAERLGVSVDELSPMFVAALGADPATLRARGEALRSVLAAGQELHITHPGGTDLRLQIADRPVRVSDGAVSPGGEEGGSGRQVWLPAGEVFLAPVPGTAAGRVVAARVPYEGGWIENLTMEVENGRVTSLTADSGAERLLAQWEAAGEGRDVLGVVDFGINPELRLDARSPGTWIADGFVSLAVGNNMWAGGENAATYGHYVHLGGATATVDGETILDNGGLVLP